MRVLVRVRLFGSLARPICESLGGGGLFPPPPTVSVNVYIRLTGGLFPPFTVSVNVYIRLTHVFLSIHYYAIYFISIHASS